MSYPTEIDPRSQARDFLALLVEREKRASMRAAEIAAGVDAGNTGINKAWVLERLRENAIKGMQQKGGSSVANRALELIGYFLVVGQSEIKRA